MSEQSELFASSERLRDAPEAENPARVSPYRRLTPEERQKERAEARARNLRAQGLQNLREGRPCSPTQAPFVGDYLQGFEARIEALKKEKRRVEIDLIQEQERVDRIIGEWNPIMEMLQKELGILLYSESSWRVECNGETHTEQAESLDQALKQAILWRFRH